MNQAIKADLTYNARDEMGTQSPVETIERRSGTCRDYAFLMVEAVRSLGFGARFVSGYLYDAKLDGGAEGTQGAGATHAWAEIYLPGAGWVEYDPTNALIGNEALIRVAVTRDPTQASLISGSYAGDADDYLGMDVEVTVTAGDGERGAGASVLPAGRSCSAGAASAMGGRGRSPPTEPRPWCGSASRASRVAPAKGRPRRCRSPSAARGRRMGRS